MRNRNFSASLPQSHLIEGKRKLSRNTDTRYSRPRDNWKKESRGSYVMQDGKVKENMMA
jgi:hypothetical protein